MQRRVLAAAICRALCEALGKRAPSPTGKFNAETVLHDRREEKGSPFRYGHWELSRNSFPLALGFSSYKRGMAPKLPVFVLV